MTVSPQELDEAYDSEFGPVGPRAADRHRRRRSKAQQVHAQAVAKPEEFPALAKKYSKDVNSASAYGLIQPIRHRSGDPKLEEEAFALKKGEISKIVKVGELYVFVKCEEQLPPPKGVDRAKVEPMLRDALARSQAACRGRRRLQATARCKPLVNVLNDPVKSKQMPGVAAMINDQKITMRELAEECIERHGTDVLEGTGQSQAARPGAAKEEREGGRAELMAEIGRAAASMGKDQADGKPDIETWIAMVTKNENISREVYVRDEVWPSVALKKLVGDHVEVTQDDLKRGYEANYGPKVQCRAIVLNNQRRAQEVWEKARENSDGQELRRPGRAVFDRAGQPDAARRGAADPEERRPAAAGEGGLLAQARRLSGVVQVGDTFVILLCEGYTKPIRHQFCRGQGPALPRHPRKEDAAGHGQDLRRIEGPVASRQLPHRQHQSPQTRPGSQRRHPRPQAAESLLGRLNKSITVPAGEPVHKHFGRLKGGEQFAGLDRIGDRSQRS